MSHLINPALLDDFLDDEPSQSAQGCFTGSDYWDAEERTDKILAAERAVRGEILWRRRVIGYLEEELVTAKEKGYTRKAERIEEQIKTHKNKISQLPPLI